MVPGGESDVLRPNHEDQIAEVFAEAAASGATIGLRGAGRSYGDASLNTGGWLLDLTGLDRILEFDAENGEVVVEPGVTIRDLWRRAIESHYWPAVVPGTMAVTCGGAAAMNIHGKNNFAVGSFGESVLEFDLLTPAGEKLVCNRSENSDVFHAAIGGFGMLGVFTRLRLKLKPVHSARMQITAVAIPDLQAGLSYLEEHRLDADYLVGWLDLYARGSALGRGVFHHAKHPGPGEDPEGEKRFSATGQDLPSRLFYTIPKGWIWPGMWLFLHGGMWRFVNAAKYHAGVREARRPSFMQPHAAFHFLLDYVPNWRSMTLPGGLIQFQPVVPATEADRVFRTIIETCQRERLIPFLAVLKRHRSDPFLMTHAVDGFSLAMDFVIKKSTKARIWEMCDRLAETVLDAGGRFYYAKDTLLAPKCFERIHGPAAVAEFKALKQRLDPEAILSTDLSRRLMT